MGGLRRRPHPISHPAVEAPLCDSCRQMDLAFFDPSCPGCRQILRDECTTTVAAVFAILRQWVPQTQRNVGMLTEEVLRRGAHVDDRDSLTDMTLLQYACKAGASGVGDADSASKAVSRLLTLGASPSRRCRWTSMTALHYAAYFDVAPALRLVLDACKGSGIDERCSEYANGGALHLAAANLCLEAATVLVQRGADSTLKDDHGRTALQCVPDPDAFALVPNVREAIERLRSILQQQPIPRNPTIKLHVGQRILLAGTKPGVLRYCGTTKFAAGMWAGIELDAPDGKHSGTVQGVTYFKCAPKKGIMAPVSRVTPTPTPSPSSLPPSTPTPDVQWRVGQRVLIRSRPGTIRFVGEVHFTGGRWVGVALDRPTGQHDGTVRGIRYFRCRPRHGLLASTRTPGGITPAPASLPPTSPSPALTSIASSAASRRTSISKDSRFWLHEGTTVLYKREVATVRYVGPVHFSDGSWLGLELRERKGRHDGEVEGRRYFQCRQGHGVVVRPKAVTSHGISGALLVPP